MEGELIIFSKCFDEATKLVLPGIKQNKNKNTQEKILHTRSPYLSFSRTRRNEKYRFFGKSISDKKKHVKSMISEIAVSHTSSYMVRGPRFLSCTTPTHIGTVVCGNYSLRCFSLYSCFLSSVLKRAANHRPQNRRASSRIIGLFVQY